jgi:hypothetical protein
MIDRRHAIRVALTLAAAPAAWLFSPAAARAQAFRRYTPLLIDLQGWKGNEPDGMAMEIPGNTVITATREYERGDARLTAQIIIGPMAQGALAGLGQTVKVETRDGRVYTAAIDGFHTMTTVNFADKSGAIIVGLGPAALFNLTFKGVAEDEAVALARRFNWKAMQAALPR